MNSIGDVLGKIAFWPVAILYFVAGCVQVLAVVDGLQYWIGMPEWLSWIGAFFLGYLPLVGSIIGYFGATEIWGWSTLASVALFFGWAIVLLFFLALVVVITALKGSGA